MKTRIRGWVSYDTGKLSRKNLAVYPSGDLEIGILVTPLGEVTNIWADGTIGVPDYEKALAREEAIAFDPETGEEYYWGIPRSEEERLYLLEEFLEKGGGR